MLATEKQLEKAKFVTVWASDDEQKSAAEAWIQETGDEDECFDEEE